MNIAIITPTLYYGGAERQIEFLALGLKQKGYNVTVYCFNDEGEIANILRKNCIKVVGLYLYFIRNLSLKRNKGSYTFLATKPCPSGSRWNEVTHFRRSVQIRNRIMRFANEFWAALRLFLIFLKDKPAVVHLYQNQTKMAILVSKLCRVKRIIYTETATIGDWLTPLQLFIMKLFWKFCDVVIVLSSAMKNHMLALSLIESSKIHVVPTMFPFSSVKSTIEGHIDDNPLITRVGIAGGLTPWKGHLFFLEAAKLINRKFDNVKFIIAGDGYSRGELKKMTRELDLEKNVRFIGAFDNIADIMNQIDIFVLSSLTEGMPLVLIEAMAYGKAVVATKVGGVNELIRDGETGFLVPPGDSGALAEAIGKLITDQQKRRDFSSETIRRFKDVFSSEKLIPKIELLYNSSSKNLLLEGT